MEAKNQIIKAARIEKQEIDEAELKKINQYTLKDLTAEEVFVFKLVLCDNEIDRVNEAFVKSSLDELSKLDNGKTVISDHSHKAENQCARVYYTEVNETGKTSKIGEPYCQLIGRCYMVRTESNKDLILEIEAGIKKEVSVCCRVETVECSICGTNNRETWCDHIPGGEYDQKTCFMKLKDAVDAYEVSFVAVPAQKQAGTIKCYGAQKPKEDAAPKNETSTKSLEARIRLSEANYFLKQEEMIHEQENA